MITYDKLWSLLKQRGVTQYKLINYYGVSPGQLTRLKRNQNVNIHTIEMLCDILDCEIGDVVEFRKDKAPYEK